MADDELDDAQPYVCVLSNDLLRSLVQGEDQRIDARTVTGARMMITLMLRRVVPRRH